MMSDETKPLGDLPSVTTDSPDPQVDQTTTERPAPQGMESGGMNSGPHQEQGGMRS